MPLYWVKKNTHSTPLPPPPFGYIFNNYRSPKATLAQMMKQDSVCYNCQKSICLSELHGLPQHVWEIIICIDRARILNQCQICAYCINFSVHPRGLFLSSKCSSMVVLKLMMVQISRPSKAKTVRKRHQCHATSQEIIQT